MLCPAVVMVLCAFQTSADVFTSMVELENTLQTEDKLAQHLLQYVRKEEARISELRQLADGMAQHSQRALGDPVRQVGNPLNAFFLLKRFTVDWDTNRIKHILLSHPSGTLNNLIETELAHLPTYNDYKGAVRGLFRLQDTYALEAGHIAKGRLLGAQSAPAMTAHDCLEIGRVAYYDRDYYHAIQWLQQALLFLHQEHSQRVDEAAILEYLAGALYMQGNVIRARNVTEQWLALQPEDHKAKKSLEFFTEIIEGRRSEGTDGDTQLGEVLHNARPKPGYHSSEHFSAYEALCRRDEAVLIENFGGLTCQYRFWHPQFYIDPLKEEIMSFDPWIVVYHQFINDREISRLKEIATPRLQRTGVIDEANNRGTPTETRISKSTWLREIHDPVVARVNQRSSALTNLSLSTAENLQVTNYGIGGHYEPHHDYLATDAATNIAFRTGNRILSAIFYLSDVEAGGATVFVEAGVRLRPERGACAVWHNLRASGERDTSTLHAACPVLLGSKWVALKWFHERGQEFRRPCDLQP